jgi:biopolymer transport protein ExbB
MLNIMQYIDRGGIIVTILIGLNILGFAIMLWKLIILSLARNQKEKMVQNTLDFIKKNNQDFDKKSLQNTLDMQIQKLESGLGTVKIIASIAPLLGLLGTVVGVLTAFAIPHYVGYNYFIGLLDAIELKLEKEVLEKL